MNENFSHIFDKTDHIDESKLWLYSKGKLHTDEAHEVEKHLVDCEMCSDIVEGFSKFSSEGNFNAAINRTSESFFNATGRKRKIIIRRLSMAAGFVLIAASSVFLITQLKQTETPRFQALNEIDSSSQGEEESIIIEDTLVEEIARVDNNQTKTQEKLPESASKSETENMERSVHKEIENKNSDQEVDMLFLSIVEDDAEAEPIMAETLNTGNSYKLDEDVPIETETVLSDINEPSPKVEQDISLGGAVMDSEETTVASRNRAAGKVSAVSQDATQPEISPFKNGMAAYYNGNYESAIQLLQEIPRRSADYWDARWTIANSYVKTQEIEKAKAEYKRIQNNENPYQYAAGEKLLELE
ncbi:MAG: tetratricopeptide repeat protein [Bacteroidales bacterium]|jgi:hypothetical protein|nr:tetratricopeptide repeat protein [Bacteroidales bacterium]